VLVVLQLWRLVHGRDCAHALVTKQSS
jgi:hypothetical protein